MENHSVQIDNREKMTITDIREIDSFDEEEIRASLRQGAMVIRGEDLHINKFSVESGELFVEGSIYALTYSDESMKKGGSGGFFSKMFR